MSDRPGLVRCARCGGWMHPANAPTCGACRIFTRDELKRIARELAAGDTRTAREGPDARAEN